VSSNIAAKVPLFSLARGHNWIYMDTTVRNSPCPCGSGKKYKKCCLDKKPRGRSVIVASSEPLQGVHYDKEKMEFAGLTPVGRLIKPVISFSQTHYKGQSGKETVIDRIQDKVIHNEAERMKYLSSYFDLIVAIDTNTEEIRNEEISVCGVVHCVLQRTADPNNYDASFPWHGVRLFRNCPSVLPDEKFGWMTEIQRINGELFNKVKRFALITDHDMNNHTAYNTKAISIFKSFYLPDNFTLIYGRADSSNQSLLNYLVKQCNHQAKEVLKMIKQTGYYQYEGARYSIDQITVPILE
jgi:hypothetical protein